MANRMNHSGTKPYFWALTACVWFAVMGLLTHWLGQPAWEGGPPRVSWAAVACVRSVVATLLAAAFTVIAGAKFVVWTPRIMWVRSLAGSTSMMATFYALAHLPTSDVLTLTNTSPIWVAILSWPMGLSKPSAGVWAAVVVAVLGVAVTAQGESAGEGLPALPAAMALVAAFFTAVAMLGLNRLAGIHPFAVVTHFSAVSAVYGAIMWTLADSPGDPEWRSHWLVWAGIVGVGVTAFLGQVFLTLAFSRGVATRVSVVGLTQVVLVMLGEQVIGWKDITPQGVFGTAMVLGPTAWLIIRSRRRVRAREVVVPAGGDEVKAMPVADGAVRR